MKEQLVSIIVPTFNREHLIVETIESFLKQTYTSFEILIVDDGSMDNTPQIITGLKDERIKYSKRPKWHKKGPSGCRNYGLSKAQGEYILFFDDDDIAHPDLLKICVQQLQFGDVDYCRYLRRVFYGEFCITYDLNESFTSFKIGRDQMEEMITNKLPFNTCAVVWKKDSLKGEEFNEDLYYSDEWEFYQRILSNGLTGVSVNKTLLFARKHNVSSTHRFLNWNPKYLNSTRLAMKTVIQNLYEKKMLTPGLEKFFIRNAFSLKDKLILKEILRKSNAGLLKTFTYSLGFELYPLIKPYFRIKKRFIR